MKRHIEAVAIMTLSEDGRIISESILCTQNTEQAIAICKALSVVEHIRTMTCRREFDVFGKLYWADESMDTEL